MVRVKVVKKVKKKNSLERNTIDEVKLKTEDEQDIREGRSGNGITEEFSNDGMENLLNSVQCKLPEALKALTEIVSGSKKQSLFPEVDQILHIQCVYKKPSNVNQEVLFKKIVLPYPLTEKENTTVCLIMRDLDVSKKARIDPDVDKQSREWETRLLNEYGIDRSLIHKILTKRQFEREYHQYADKRRLASAYDIFLVDGSVAKSVFRLCGKEFRVAKKMPIIINFDHGSVLKQIDQVYSTITLPLSANRTRVSLRIGNLRQTSQNLIDNAMMAISSLINYCPGGYANIRSLYIQLTSGGPTLPLYVTLDSANAINFNEPTKKPKKREYKGEISTLPEGLEVKVKVDGEIHVINSETGRAVRYPTLNDECEERDDIKPRIGRKAVLRLQRRSKRRNKTSKVKKTRMKKETGVRRIGSALVAGKKSLKTGKDNVKRKSINKKNTKDNMEKKKLTDQSPEDGAKIGTKRRKEKRVSGKKRKQSSNTSEKEAKSTKRRKTSHGVVC